MSDIFSRFILWLKKIFHICSKTKIREETNKTSQFLDKKSEEVTSDDKSLLEVSQQEGKSADLPLTREITKIASVNQTIPTPIYSEEEKDEVKLPEKLPEPLQDQETPATGYVKKATSSGDLAIERPEEEKLIKVLPRSEKQGEIPSAKKFGEDNRFEEKAPEVLQRKEVAKTTTQKPYIKKAPTEERKKDRKEQSEEEKKASGLRQREKIDLGKIRLTKQPEHPGEADIKKAVKASNGKTHTTRIKSPYVEIDLDEAKVSLIIPEQQFKVTTENSVPQQLNYRLMLNDGDEQTIAATVSRDKQSIAIVEEKRIDLEQPLKNFRIVYPNELQGRVYIYQHNNEILYPFIAIGNSRSRMHYLYDSVGNLNPLPKKTVWILLGECFDLSLEPRTIEEIWIWEKYQPKCFDLQNIDTIVVKNRQTEEEIKISCKASFSIEGDGLVEDDFKEQMPLFAGNSIKIKAPAGETPDGWLVWLQNKEAGYKIIAGNWTGNKPLELKLPDDLPCECGEFQVDVCEREDGVPFETLFFRYIPSFELRYPRELIIPEVDKGHKKEVIQILLKDFCDWELKTDKEFEKEDNSYRVKLPAEQDILLFSLIKKNKPETKVNLKITIPRLKWRTSRQKAWNYKLASIRREELILGEEFNLFINTNDLNIRYHLLARLETSGQKLQEAIFSRSGSHYIVHLNQFYDTIGQNKAKLTLKIEIRRDPNDNNPLGMLEILQFMEVTQESLRTKSIPNDLINFISLPKICAIIRRIKTICPEEKIVCKSILQIYYHKIGCRKKAKRDIAEDKRDFVIKVLAFMKFIMNYYDKKVQIKKQKKWRRMIENVQKKYPEEFDNAYDKFSRR